MEWMNEGPLTPARRCSDYYLGAAKLQLDSPFGYSDGFASQHIFQISSCSNVGYAFTNPAPYTISQAGTTTTSSGASTPTMDSSCITLYTIQSGDTCNKIAEARNVSSYAVYGPNGVSDCSELPTGKKARATSTGQSLTDAEVFVGWNPSINAACTNLVNFVGDFICLSRPMGLLNPKITNDFIPNTVSAWPTGTPVAESRLPIASGTIVGCLEYRNAKKLVPLQDSYYSSQYQIDTSMSNNCGYAIQSHEISMTDFLQWNPTLQNNQTQSGDPPIEATICRNVSMADIPTSTTKSCTCFTEFGGYDKEILDCSLLVSLYNITRSELITWNPWFASNYDINLFSGLGEWSLRGVYISTSGPGSPTPSVQPSSTSSRSASSTGVISSRVTTRPSTTSNVPSTTVRTTTSASSPVNSPPGSVFIGGTGEGNHIRLCDFSCHLAYCPAPVCTCLSYGNAVPRPSATWPPGYPAPVLDDSYLGLCSFSCNHRYCPPGACTTTPR
ncbi:hypothetical protein IFR05_010949 [Cadophora sp. M221]|nr:hypothetical protein IFR05_010949 [Cadophora sp. M221]